MPAQNNEGLITLTSDDVLDFALDTLLKGVKLYINGRKCTAENIWEIILKASAGQTSVNDVCDDLDGAPNGNTVLGHVHNSLPQALNQLWRLEAKLNRVLVLNVPARLLRVRCDLAIDLVLVPYHGEPAKDDEEVKRGVAREGTTHFHCYATAYMVYQNQRLTLAMTFVRKSDTMVKILGRLFKRLDVLKIRIKKAYLDKGFYRIAVIRFLKARDLPFIIPAVTRKNGGVGKLFIGLASYATTYTLRSQKLGTETVDVALTRKYSKGRYRRKRSKWFAYVTYRIRTQPLQIFQFYRRRFGIESSYRQMNRVRARTSSTNPALRLLFVGVAFLILNLWVVLKRHWRCDIHRRGTRQNHRGLTVLRLCHFLIRAIERRLRTVEAIRTPGRGSPLVMSAGLGRVR
jgi:putative transposase